MIPPQMVRRERDWQGDAIQTQQLQAPSEAGPQYVSFTYFKKLAMDGIAPSIGSFGDSYDNTLIDTVSGLSKAECLRSTAFRDALQNHRRCRIRDHLLGGWGQQPSTSLES